MDEHGRISVCLVGSRIKDHYDRFEDAKPRWSTLGDRLSIVGIDADPEAVAASNKRAEAVAWSEHHVHAALWSTRGTQTLYVTATPSASSVYRPRDEYQKKHAWYRVVREVPVETILLDDLSLPPVDFMQIDVQGGELEILKGAERTMESVLCAIVEVSNVEVYEGQSLWPQVDEWFIAHGFRKSRSFPVDAYSADIMYYRPGEHSKIDTILGWFA
ncbi:MAG: FkbM family methyltransferase [Phycisphaerae bacterium]|nr:FkbM family methyltransferase [Phycisphaerae bacterium]